MIEAQGIPMLFIHMVTRDHSFILLSQFQRPVRITFEVHPPLLLSEAKSSEHFPGDFVDKSLWPKGGAFSRLRKAQEMRTAIIEGKFHW